MSPWQELRRLSLKTRAYLIAVFVLFNVFAVVRALPVNSQLSENREADRGTYNRNVYRVFRLANDQAARPFFEVRNHAIFFDRNPGLFMFVAELFVRAGATTPFPNQLLAILLWNCGLLLLFLWLLRLFDNEPAAAAGLGLVVVTPFVLFYSSSIHHEPWCFCFFNLTFYCFVRYLREGKPRRLARLRTEPTRTEHDRREGWLGIDGVVDGRAAEVGTVAKTVRDLAHLVRTGGRRRLRRRFRTADERSTGSRRCGGGLGVRRGRLGVAHARGHRVAVGSWLGRGGAHARRLAGGRRG